MSVGGLDKGRLKMLWKTGAICKPASFSALEDGLFFNIHQSLLIDSDSHLKYDSYKAPSYYIPHSS